MNDLQLFQFTDKYARWNDNLQRREQWHETIQRAVNFLRELSNNALDDQIYNRIYELMLNMEIAPSMRLLAMAGEPARRNNIALYNCAYLTLDSVDSFTELMVVLLEGAGCGYSVESKHVYKLPIVKRLNGEVVYHSIPDTSEGWYESFRLLLNNLYNGVETKFDYSMIRPAGSRLKIKGGTASGAEPLKRLFDFCKSTFRNAQGRKLTTLEAHDIACHVGDAIVSGGVRRSALIALFDEGDEDMLNCKSIETEWWNNHSYRGRANNSIVINEPKDYQWFVDYVKGMDGSQAGEPGLISRYAMQNTIPDRRKFDANFGTNPCCNYYTKVKTPQGLKMLGDLEIGEQIWSKEGWTTVLNKACTGIKPVYKYQTKYPDIYLEATDNHIIISEGKEIEIGKTQRVDIFKFGLSTETVTEDIVNVDYLGYFPVYDITVDNQSHTFWANQFDIHNCGEIYLKPFQFCNLSIVVARPYDTLESLQEKVYYSTIIGTIQSMATNFKGLRPIWKQNCESERLLGVDITGQWDCPLLVNEGNEFVFESLKMLAIDTNKKFASQLGINQSVAVTCVKPSGNSSVLFSCSSGLHTNYSKYYLRRVRIQKDSPIANWLEDCGFALEQDKGQVSSLVATFPVKSPDSPHYKADVTALEQLNHWKVNKLYWTEHNPSITVSYHKEELDIIARWLYENQDIIGGLSFLPQSDFVYEQAPYEAISQSVYEYWRSITPHLDMSLLSEVRDNTNVAQELACFAGGCEI